MEAANLQALAVAAGMGDKGAHDAIKKLSTETGTQTRVPSEPARNAIPLTEEIQFDARKHFRGDS